MHNKNIVLNIESNIAEIRGLVMLANSSIKQEDLSSFVKQIGNFFSVRLEKVGAAMGLFGNKKKNGVTEFDDPSEFVNVLAKNRKKIDKASNANYGVYEKMRIPTVPGLYTNIIDATDKTIEMISKINTILEPKLDELDTIISKVLSDEAFRTSTRPIIHDKSMEKMIEDLQKTINSFISSKNQQDTVLLGEIFPNMRSIKDCYEKIINTASHGGIDQLKHYKKKIDTIVDKIDFLVKELKAHPDMVVSKVVLKELSVATEETAELVTIGMNVFFLFNQITGVLRNVSEGVK